MVVLPQHTVSHRVVTIRLPSIHVSFWHDECCAIADESCAAGHGSEGFSSCSLSPWQVGRFTVGLNERVCYVVPGNSVVTS